jgi:hypothetical protein
MWGSSWDSIVKNAAAEVIKMKEQLEKQVEESIEASAAKGKATGEKGSGKYGLYFQSQLNHSSTQCT